MFRWLNSECPFSLCFCLSLCDHCLINLFKAILYDIADIFMLLYGICYTSKFSRNPKRLYRPQILIMHFLYIPIKLMELPHSWDFSLIVNVKLSSKMNSNIFCLCLFHWFDIVKPWTLVFELLWYVGKLCFKTLWQNLHFTLHATNASLIEKASAFKYISHWRKSLF